MVVVRFNVAELGRIADDVVFSVACRSFVVAMWEVPIAIHEYESRRDLVQVPVPAICALVVANLASWDTVYNRSSSSAIGADDASVTELVCICSG